MAWAKFDDRWWAHPKMAAAGLEAAGLDAKAICYVAGHETDGFVSDDAMPILAPGHRKPHTVAARLVEVGRWTRDENRKGYWIHDFLKYNQSRDVAEAKREAERERKAAARTRAARTRDGTFVSARTDDGQPPDDGRNPAGHPSDVERCPPYPDPTRPDPVVKPPQPPPSGGQPSAEPSNPRALGTNPRSQGSNPRGPKPPDPREATALAEHERMTRPRCDTCAGSGWGFADSDRGEAERCPECNPGPVLRVAT